jgi:hypothetical protein
MIISDLKGVKSVEPTLSISPGYIQNGSGTKYTLTARRRGLPGITLLQLATGSQLSSTSSASQIVLAKSYVKAPRLSSNAAAIGATGEDGASGCRPQPS